MVHYVVDWSGDWATPWGLASQMRPWSVAKRLNGRAQSERKSTTRYGDELYLWIFKNQGTLIV